MKQESNTAKAYMLQYARQLISRGIFKKAGNLYFVDKCLAPKDFEIMILSIIENGFILTAGLRQALINHLQACHSCQYLFRMIHLRIMEYAEKHAAGEMFFASLAEMASQARISVESDIEKNKGALFLR